MDMSVAEAFFSRVPPTLSLAILAQIFAVIIALFLGIIAARKEARWQTKPSWGSRCSAFRYPAFCSGYS